MKEQLTFWRAVLQELQSSITPEMFKAWILPVEAHSAGDDALVLRVPTQFFVTFLKTNFESKIVNALIVVTGKEYAIAYNVTDEAASSSDRESSLFESLPQANVVELPSRHTQTNSQLRDDYTCHPLIRAPGLRNPKNLVKCALGYVDLTHTFESFIVGEGTQFAHAASGAAANFPGAKYNPLLIHGPSGLGKTHLLHAIGIEILRKNQQARICYISAEEFVNEFIEAIRNKATNSFHARYRSGFDAFLIDDIHFFCGKERSGEEFFHTFNHLFGGYKQVVITSDKHPKDLLNLEDRLVTRLSQGLVVEVKPPDLDTRIAILRAKAEADDLYLPDDVCLLIAAHIKNNVRDLEGALVRLSADASINGTEITLDMARETLSGLLKESKNSSLSVESINKYVSQYFKITINEMTSASRMRKFTQPRQIAMYFVRKYAKKTFPEIAAAFGGKDHSTVMYAIKKVEKEIQASEIMRKYVEDIRLML